MKDLKQKVCNYLSDDSAISMSVETIIGVVAAIVIGGGVVYYVYHLVSKQAKHSSDLLNQGDPGEGKEFDNSNIFGGGSGAGGGD